MSDPFIGEIKVFGGNFAPRGWALCDGQLLPISQFTAVFSLLGTMYGGDGRTTFGLPDLRGRVPVHQGQGPGLGNYVQGQRGGSTTTTLTAAQLPSHGHAARAATAPGSTHPPAGGTALARSAGGNAWSSGAPDTQLAADALTPTGGGQAHNNLQPYLALYFIIALEGLFPSRS